MKTNELRIGNYVYAGHGDFPMYVTHIFPDDVYLNFDGNEGDPWEEKEKDLKPIPITEDILSKCNFCGQDCIIHYPAKRTYYILQGALVVVEYLHELQNLHFSITGKELEVKL